MMNNISFNIRNTTFSSTRTTFNSIQTTLRSAKTERMATVPALSFQVFTTEVVYAANPNKSVYFR